MNSYTVRLLLEKFSLVVPEIQREYVWGNNKTVLDSFLKDLNARIIEGVVNIGFLYSYQSNSNSEEHYLIDGQQRFTTIVLLLYYLSIKEGKDDFERLLRVKDNVPAFTYRVRNSTEVFLRDLFLNGEIDVKNIENSKWYRNEYKHDPTIVAMLNTLKYLDINYTLLQNLTVARILDLVEFWYFDVEQTSQGEELYITMNSRGEKLSDFEQLKPRLFAKLDSRDKEKYGKLWDDWEEFFFQNKGDRDIKAVDVAMNNMIRIILELKTQTEHVLINPVKDAERISVADLNRYMERIVDDSLDDEVREEIVDMIYGDSKKDGYFYCLKALLIELIKNPQDRREYRRIRKVMQNIVRRGVGTQKPKEYLSFLRGYEMSSDCFYDYILNNKDQEGVKSIFTPHECDKIEIYNKTKSIEVEECLWGAQEKKFWDGNIKPLIRWSVNGDGLFDLDRFKYYNSRFDLLFNQNESNGWTSDDVRRAFLCLGLENYPIKYKNRNWVSFGYDNWEWITLFWENSDKIKRFFDGVGENVSPEQIGQYLGQITQIDSQLDFAEFVEHKYLLEYLNTKHIQWNDECGWVLVKNNWAHPVSVKNEYLYESLRNKFSNGWYLWVWTSWWVVVLKNESVNIEFYIWYLRKDNVFRIEINKREDGGESIKNDIDLVVENGGWMLDGDKYYKLLSFDIDRIETFLCELVAKIDSIYNQ